MTSAERVHLWLSASERTVWIWQWCHVTVHILSRLRHPCKESRRGSLFTWTPWLGKTKNRARSQIASFAHSSLWFQMYVLIMEATLSRGQALTRQTRAFRQPRDARFAIKYNILTIFNVNIYCINICMCEYDKYYAQSFQSFFHVFFGCSCLFQAL